MTLRLAAAALLLIASLFGARSGAEDMAPAAFPEHPRARALVQQLATSEDPAVRAWGWKHLEIMAEGALPAMQPLFDHADPLFRLRAVEVVSVYRQLTPERVPPTLKIPEKIEFPRERIDECIFEIAERAGRSLIVHDGALANASAPLVLRAAANITAGDRFDDLQDWAESDSGVDAVIRGGILIIRKPRGADELPYRDAGRLEIPQGLSGEPVSSRIMRARPPIEAMQLLRATPPRAGFLILPGAWQADGSISYVIQSEQWTSLIDAMADASDLRVFFAGNVLVVAGPKDAVADAATRELWLSSTTPPTSFTPAPRLRHFDLLEPLPGALLAALAGRAGLVSVLLADARAHLEALPLATRSGIEPKAPSAWVRFVADELPAHETLFLVARLFGLEPCIDGKQVTFSVLAAAPSEER